MIVVFALLVGIVFLPALALAGWRAGRRAAPGGLAQPPQKALRRPLSGGSAGVRPRVRSGSYKRSEGGRGSR